MEIEKGVLRKQKIRRGGTARKIEKKLNIVLGVVMFDLLIRGMEFVIEILEWMNRGIPSG